MRGFKEIFEAYGADYDTTIGRFAGNEAVYLRILDMLFEDDNLQKLGTALDGGDQHVAFEAAHTLKGVTANMGLTPFYDAVCEIVEPLRTRQQREDYPGLYQAVVAEFHKVEKLREQLRGGE